MFPNTAIDRSHAYLDSSLIFTEKKAILRYFSIHPIINSCKFLSENLLSQILYLRFAQAAHGRYQEDSPQNQLTPLQGKPAISAEIKIILHFYTWTMMVILFGNYLKHKNITEQHNLVILYFQRNNLIQVWIKHVSI